MAPRGRKARVNPKKKTKDNTPEHSTQRSCGSTWSEARPRALTRTHSPGGLINAKETKKEK